MTEITVENIKKMRLRDGDVLIVEMPEIRLPRAEMAEVMRTWVDRIEFELVQAGFDCRVICLQHGARISVVTKEERADVLREVQGRLDTEYANAAGSDDQFGLDLARGVVQDMLEGKDNGQG